MQGGGDEFAGIALLEGGVACLEDGVEEEVEDEVGAFAGALVVEVQVLVDFGLPDEVFPGEPLLVDLELATQVAHDRVAFHHAKPALGVLQGRHQLQRVNLLEFLRAVLTEKHPTSPFNSFISTTSCGMLLIRHSDSTARAGCEP